MQHIITERIYDRERERERERESRHKAIYISSSQNTEQFTFLALPRDFTIISLNYNSSRTLPNARAHLQETSKAQGRYEETFIAKSLLKETSTAQGQLQETSNAQARRQETSNGQSQLKETSDAHASQGRDFYLGTNKQICSYT